MGQKKDASAVTGSAKDALGAVLGRKEPKTARGRRILRKREPKVHEDPKTALIMRGNRSSNDVLKLLRDLYRIRMPLATLFARKHDDHPFEDHHHLEKLCANHDHSLFVFGSSSKKRPFRVIFGRLFSQELLDMQEFSVTDYKPIHSFAHEETAIGSKPLILFQGASFETNDLMKRAKSLLLDFFNAATPEQVALKGIEHVITCSVVEPTGSKSEVEADKSGLPAIHIHRYKINLQKSSTRLPGVELEELGPSFTLTLDRTRDPDKNRWKQSIKVPKQAKPTKVKNVKTDELGKRKGRIHLGRQDFDQIHTVHHGQAKRKKLQESLTAQMASKAPKGEAGATASGASVSAAASKDA